MLYLWSLFFRRFYISFWLDNIIRKKFRLLLNYIIILLCDVSFKIINFQPFLWKNLNQDLNSYLLNALRTLIFFYDSILKEKAFPISCEISNYDLFFPFEFNISKYSSLSFFIVILLINFWFLISLSFFYSLDS